MYYSESSSSTQLNSAASDQPVAFLSQIHRGCFSFSAPHSLPHFADVDFSFLRHLNPFCHLLHPPAFLRLVLPPPPPPRPTGIVILSPHQRLTDFILLRLWLLPLMMCLVPSCFDVDCQSLMVDAASVFGEGGIVCERFRVRGETRNGGEVELM